MNKDDELMEKNKDHFVLAIVLIIAFCTVLACTLSIKSLSDNNAALTRQVKEMRHEVKSATRCDAPASFDVFTDSKPLDDITIDMKHNVLRVHYVSVTETQVPFVVVFDCSIKANAVTELVLRQGVWEANIPKYFNLKHNNAFGLIIAELPNTIDAFIKR